MKIKLASVMVDDQKKALEFYTNVLGFVKKVEMPMGEFTWLTVVSPEGSDEVELALEPNAFPAAAVFQSALHEAGIPWTCFFVEDIHAEYARLKDKGVEFKGPPAKEGTETTAMFDDTCGNLIQICQG